MPPGSYARFQTRGAKGPLAAISHVAPDRRPALEQFRGKSRCDLQKRPSPTSHSNRSLRTEVSVAGKRNFQSRDKEAETALEIQGRRCRDKISLGNSANSGLIAEFREISVRTRMRGGPGRTRTANQIVMKWSRRGPSAAWLGAYATAPGDFSDIVRTQNRTSDI